MKKVSIIIPVYNTEKYLDECFESIEKQNFDINDIEVIIINDGSNDNSLEIIKKYRKKHSDWIVIDRENKGLSCSRNEGIEKSTASYIMFLDSDDYLDSEALKCMYEFAINNNSDVVIARLNGFDSNGFYGYYSDKLINNFCNFKYKNNKKILKAISVCSKLYKRDLLKNIRFIPGVKHEDNFFTCHVYTKANIISTIPRYYYYRRYREGERNSITQNLSLDSFDNLVYNFSEFFKSYGIENYILKFSIKSLNNYVISKLKKGDRKKAKLNIQKYLINLKKCKIVGNIRYIYYEIYNKTYYFLANTYFVLRSCIKHEK